MEANIDKLFNNLVKSVEDFTKLINYPMLDNENQAFSFIDKRSISFEHEYLLTDDLFLITFNDNKSNPLFIEPENIQVINDKMLFITEYNNSIFIYLTNISKRVLEIKEEYK